MSARSDRMTQGTGAGFEREAVLEKKLPNGQAIGISENGESDLAAELNIGLTSRFEETVEILRILAEHPWWGNAVLDERPIWGKSESKTVLRVVVGCRRRERAGSYDIAVLERNRLYGRGLIDQRKYFPELEPHSQSRKPSRDENEKHREK